MDFETSVNLQKRFIKAMYKFDPMDFETKLSRFGCFLISSINLILWILKPNIFKFAYFSIVSYKFDPMDFETCEVPIVEPKNFCINLILWILKHL